MAMTSPTTTLPILRITNGHIRHSSQPSTIFKNLTFSIYPVTNEPVPRWSVIGQKKNLFLQVLQGKQQCLPHNARTYPGLSAKGKWPESCIGLVEFTSTGGLGERIRGEYLSSRYESRREATDITLREWLRRTAEHMPTWTDNYDFNEGVMSPTAKISLDMVAKGLNLERVLAQPVNTLSNGQGRRARIAQSLLRDVDLLLLDEPFMGLDLPSATSLSHLLDRISSSHKDDVKTQIVLGLRSQDAIPEWISHLVYTDQNDTTIIGEKLEVMKQLSRKGIAIKTENASTSLLKQVYATEKSSVDPATGGLSSDNGEIIVQMEDVNIAYWGKEILKDFSWTIRRGQRWGLFGPNGSGKTTVLSLLCSDHPLSYSLPILLFGSSRLPSPGKPGISVFDVQARIGHSSPEIHQFFPRYRTLRQCVQSAFADTFLSKANLTTAASSSIEAILEHFMVPKDQHDIPFGELSLASQKLALFMRALVKRPDLVILDEAFSGMNIHMREKCIRYLRDGGLNDNQALICVSHVDEEIPDIVDRWVRLREAGIEGGPIFGKK